MNPPSRSKPRSATSGRPIHSKTAIRDEKKQKSKDTTSESIKTKEEHFRQLNAELEAKTATLVKEAEELMKEHTSILLCESDASTDVTADVHADGGDGHSLPTTGTAAQPCAVVPRPGHTTAAAPSSRLKSAAMKAKRKSVPDECPASPIAEHIHSEVRKAVEQLENQLDMTTSAAAGDDDDGGGGDGGFDVVDMLPEAAEEMGTEAVIRFLKAKLRVMQEEMDRLYAKSNENEKETSDLKLKLKNLTEQNLKLQNSYQMVESQSDHHRQTAEALKHKCEGLEAQVVAARKEVDELKMAQRKAATSQSSVEVRLNRAVEEAEKYKALLMKERTDAKELSKHDKQQLDHLVSENRQLERQKADLMAGFKKQLKLIDILKRQKMHIEAAKVLNFTEEEFIRALDWGTS